MHVIQRSHSSKIHFVLTILCQVMARSSPTDKLLLVQALKRKGEVVSVTGDGTNDAPALHEVRLNIAVCWISNYRTKCYMLT